MLFCQVSLYDLCYSVLENNSDIKAAEKNYTNAVLSKKGADGYFSPSVSVSSSATLPNEYEFDKSPDSFISSINYTQPLLSGTSVSIFGNYSYSVTENERERFIFQNPQITFKLTQSLFPFWIQGHIKDPYLLTLKEQKEYFYNQLLYAKQKVIQEFIQNYIYAQVEYKKNLMLKNSINLTQKQIDELNVIKKSGGINSSRISELENTKWTYQQDLLSSELSIKSYLQKIKYLTNKDFSESFFFEEKTYNTDYKDFISFITEISDCDFDSYEKSLLIKIEIEKTSAISIQQDSSPSIEFSVQPAWNLEQKKINEWSEAWQSNGSPKSWTVGVTINLSPLFNSFISKRENKQKLELESALNTYNSYTQQKSFVKSQYTNYILEYEKHFSEISKLIDLWEKQLEDMKFELEQGLISKLDYENKAVQLSNMKLSSECIQLYIFLYQVLDALCF